jgi:hypothetical protein
MLTTATMVMPLGTDPANVRHASAERTDATGTSFAKSFEESSALVVAPVSQDADKKPQGSADLEESVPGNDRGIGSAVTPVAVKQNGNAADEIQKESANVKNLPTLPSGKVTPSMTAGVTLPSTGVLPQGGNTKGSSPVIETEGPVGSLSAESKTESKDVKNVDQKNTPTIVDAKTDATDATDATIDLGADGDASVAAAFSVIKTQIEDTKAQPILEKSPGAIATEKETKGHDGVVKTGKPDKTEEKKTAAAVAAQAGVDVQVVVAAMVVVAPVDGTKPPSNTGADEDALSSVGPPATGHGVATAMARAGVPGNGLEAVKKSDSDNGKMTGQVLVDDSASQKSEVKESKTPLSATKPAAGDNAAAPMAVSGTAHAEFRMAGVETGGVAGGAAHVVVGGSVQATASNPHVATVLASTAMDSGVVVDAEHKTLMATPTSLEIGVANGTHGWLKIRADMTDGGLVNASLSTGTSSGQEMLHRELPSLTAYLQNERVAVNAVVIQPSMTPGADLRGLQGGMAGDGRGLAQQSGGQGGENQRGAADYAPVQIEREEFYSGRNGVGRDELLPLATRAGGGNWLNVRA